MRLFKSFISVLFGAAITLPAMAEITAPEIRKQDVEERFGQRLEQADRAENLLLLGIALDTVSTNSRFKDQQIGIPYLVGDGASYWAMLLSQGIRSPDVLVNNALMLLFADKGEGVIPHDQRVSAAVRLLKAAETRGYWPATAYLAEHFFELARQAARPPMMPKNQIQNGYRDESIARYVSCAKTGFAPCHLKVGIWYMADQKVEAAMPYLKAGVELVRRDPRYLKTPDVVEDVEFALAILSSPTLDHKAEERELFAALHSEIQGLRAPVNGIAEEQL